MKTITRSLPILLVAGVLVTVPPTLAQSLADARVGLAPGSLTVEPPAGGPVDSLVVHIMAPDDAVIELRSDGEALSWRPDAAADGDYRYEVWARRGAEGAESAADSTGEGTSTRRSRGRFSIRGGVIVDREDGEPVGWWPPSGNPLPALADLVLDGVGRVMAPVAGFLVGSAHADDLTASSTLPRVFFNTTGNAVPFEWQVLGFSAASERVFQISDVLSSTAIGGDKVIQLLSNGNSEFSLTVENTGDVGLADDSVFVDRSSGRLGIGTVTPPEEISVASSSPAISLNDTDGVVWEINSTGTSTVFDIANVTDGNNMLTLEKDAPTDSLVLDAAGVGFGTRDPDGSLHVLETNGEKPSLILETLGGAVPTKWEIKTNETTGRLTFKNLNGTNGPNGGPTTPFKFQPTAAENLFRVGVVDDDTVDINGNLIVTGNCTEQNGACADYVFEEDYALPTLDELSGFIAANGHLPNVPSAAEIEARGVNLAGFTGRLLEKIEELTLYTLAQEETIRELRDDNHRTAERYRQSMDEVRRRLSALER